MNDRTMHFTHIQLVSFMIVASLHATNASSPICDKIQDTGLNNSCDLAMHVDEMSDCRTESGRVITTRGGCIEEKRCCWNNRTRLQCFAKPVKCYIDLRRGKCIDGLDSTGIDSIYSGYSTNGSFCFAKGVVIADQSVQKLLGYVHDFGFPIHDDSPPCKNWWYINVTKYGEDNCIVNVYENEAGTKFRYGLEGKLVFNRRCIHKKNGNIFPFPFDPDRQMTKLCMCEVDAWLRPHDEDLPVSDHVRDYVRIHENRSTCSQIVGVIVRSSWQERVSLISRVEVDEMLNAVNNLTDIHKTRDMTLNDTQVLLRSARKVAGYPFYEGIEEPSALQIMKKSTSFVSNIIGRMADTPRVNVAASTSSNDVLTAPVLEDDDENNNEETVKHDLFETFASLSQVVAANTRPRRDGSEFLIHVNESFVDMQLAIVKPDNVTSLLKKPHHTYDHSNHDEVAIYKVPDIQQTDSNVERVAYISVFYDYPISDADLNKRVSGYVSVDVRKFADGIPHPLSVAVNFSLARQSHGEDDKLTPVCSFLTSNTSKESWDDHGCITYNYPNSTTCSCNHTTHFAVLMKFDGGQLSTEHNRALEIIALILGSLSIACLCVTMMVFIGYRRTLMKDRMLIHFHLVVALLFAYISILTSSVFSSPRDTVISTTCLVCAATTHFFFLAVFFWSLVEGVYLFYKIVLVFQRKWAECVPSYSPLVGWIFPLVIVVITFVLSRTPLLADPDHPDQDPYATSSTCFLRVNNNIIWAYVGPVVFVICVNIIVLLKVTYIIFKSAYTSNKLSSADKRTRINESLKRSSRGALLLMPILGIPTIFGILYSFYPKTVDSALSKTGAVVGTMGAYLQVILTGIQGIMIFFFYCLHNAEVRGAYALAIKRRKSAGSLDSSSGGRKRSRLALLFNREEEKNCLPNYNRSASHGQTRRHTNASGAVSLGEPVTYGRSISVDDRIMTTKM